MRARTPLPAALAALGVLALAPGPALAKHVTGTYRGSTSQRIGIEFVAGKHAVRAVTYAVKYHCSSGRSYYGNPLESSGRYRIRSGRFHAHWASTSGATISDVRGHIRGRRAWGTVSRTIRIDSAEQQPDPEGDELCESGVLHFRARAMRRGPTAGSARARCGRGQHEIRGRLRGRRLVVSPGQHTPILACASPPPEGVAAGYRASERLLGDPRLVHRRVRGAHRHLLRAAPALRRSERVAQRAIDRFMLAALRRPAPVARAARHTESGPLPGGTEHGANVTGRGLRIDPAPDEIGEGGETDYTAVVNLDRVRSTTRRLQREATFAKRCPDANGHVKGDYEFRDLLVQANEAVGRRAVESTDVHVNATFEGHVNDDAELVDYDIDGEFVIEVKGRVEIAATGKLMTHAPTRVVRGRFSARGARSGQHSSLGETNASVVGPKGWIGGDIGWELYFRAQWGADVEISKILDRAEQFWRETENKATGEVGGNCVRLAFSPERLRIAQGDTQPVEVRLISKLDGAEVAAKHQLADVTNAIPEGTTEPSAATSAPGAPAIFRYTSPDPEDPDPWFSFEERATSKRGIAVAYHEAEPIPPAPRAYVGTISGYSHSTTESGIANEDWATADVRFEREPGSPDDLPRYDLVAGHVNWSTASNFPAIDCTSSGAATLNAVGGDLTLGSIDFGSRTQYLGRARYLRQATVTTVCQGIPITGPGDVFPVWWDSNANQGYFNTVGPNWKLQGESNDAGGGIEMHWEWSLTPIF
jgi:hypothetical protein